MAATRIHSVRPPAVAGLFYPADPGALTARIEALLDECGPGPQAADARVPRALIAPHAAYPYSGPVAASAYRLLGRASGVRRIVLLGPSHYAGCRGVALPAAAMFATPLGTLGVDGEALRALRELPCLIRSDSPHIREHSLEVQLPFLQHLFGDTPIVPIVTGSASATDIEAVIDALWEARTLLIVSSDLSHYQPYHAAQAIDAGTARAILEGREDLSAEQACGCIALNGLARAARKRGLEPVRVDLRNSGDTAGDRRRVVGYGAFAFYGP